VRHGARLKGWRRTESDGGALQMPYVPNGMKGHKSIGQTDLCDREALCFL
jgi:hypothetical protein